MSLSVDNLSYSHTRANLRAVLDKVVADRVPVAVTRRWGEGVVLIAQSEWNLIEETLRLSGLPEDAECLQIRRVEVIPPK